MGRVESGSIGIGDAVTVLPSGKQTRVKDIRVLDRSFPRAYAEQSITLLLEDEIDISRGDMIVQPEKSALVTRQIDAMVCWLAETPLDLQRKYLIRQTTRESKAVIAGIGFRVDINTLDHISVERLEMNDIANISLRLAQPLSVDAYTKNRATGAFIIIDESTNNTVAAGMIL